MLANISILFLIIGVAIAFFGGGVPIGGFKNNKELSDSYLASVGNGERPTPDQQGAYCTVLCYKYGLSAVFIAILMCFLSILFD